jgi:hypothetical protein
MACVPSDIFWVIGSPRLKGGASYRLSACSADILEGNVKGSKISDIVNPLLKSNITLCTSVVHRM